jgi:hypothetical protein
MQERTKIHDVLWLVSLMMSVTGMLLLSIGLEVL